jgi:hypothetical protein
VTFPIIIKDHKDDVRCNTDDGAGLDLGDWCLKKVMNITVVISVCG